MTTRLTLVTLIVRHSLRVYILCLITVLIVWLSAIFSGRIPFARNLDWSVLLGTVALYLLSHIVRMFRLILLTLDQRRKCFPIALAHALTAFPSNLLPFKIGEILRLVAINRVFDTREKAVAVWLVERLGDMLILSLFLLSLSWFGVKVPQTVVSLGIVFVIASGLCIGGSFAILKVFNYLNSHLVLNSLSARGLTLLRAGHTLHILEIAIRKSLEGRVIGFLLLSTLIWLLEIFALSIFINEVAAFRTDFAAIFARGLLASLFETASNAFGAYRSAALASLAIVSLLLLSLAKLSKNTRM
jgi:hypothetical protein